VRDYLIATSWANDQQIRSSHFVFMSLEEITISKQICMSKPQTHFQASENPYISYKVWHTDHGSGVGGPAHLVDMFNPS
jgi:hypothetical protein